MSVSSDHHPDVNFFCCDLHFSATLDNRQPLTGHFPRQAPVGSAGRAGSNSEQAKRRVVKLVTIVILIFTVSWLPLQVQYSIVQYSTVQYSTESRILFYHGNQEPSVQRVKRSKGQNVIELHSRLGYLQNISHPSLFPEEGPSC